MGICENMKLKRNELGMSQEEVGDMVGVSKQTIQRYESGEISNIPSDKIEKVAMALKVTPAYLMGWDIEDKKEKEIHYISEDRKIVINAISELTADDFKYVMDLVERLKTNKNI